MLAYWLIFGFVAYMAFASRQVARVYNNGFNGGSPQNRGLRGFYFVFVVLVLTIGFRFEVGGDWGNYLPLIERAKWLTLTEALSRGDPAYEFLNWLGANWFGGIYLVNLVCAAFFTWGLLVFCNNQPRPWLALLVAVPYLVTVVAMGYTRQGIAIGIAMLALAALQQGSIRRYVLYIAFAALFHKSAVILMPLAILFSTKNRWLVMIAVGLVSFVTYIYLLADSVQALTTNYISAEYDSAGAFIRIIMNALPATIFLLYRRRFNLEPAQLKFWAWVSYIALALLVALYISPSSTAVDRVALYFIPIQMFVLSWLPDAISKNRNSQVWVLAVVAYSASVLFVWLFFATHAGAWLPYQFYPWVWLWS
jgi:hypothetical protein